jgi:hypothetical protein
MSKAIQLLLAGVVVTTATAVTAGGQAKPATPAADANGVNVTVKYTGKGGTVDANHKIFVWLFDTPKIGPEANPIAELAIEKNGGTARFTGVIVKEVYVAVAFDEKGGFAGQAPPPTGSPIAVYGAKNEKDPPLAVTPGPKSAVTIALTDAQRMP